MTSLANFIFSNIFLILLLIFAYYIFHEYKDLKDKSNAIDKLFENTLNKYLELKINEARQLADQILISHGEEEIVAAEISRLLLMIEKGVTGTINEKVSTSNAINKFKLNKSIDYEKYPYLLELNNIGTFTEEDMNDLENGVAIARREYNARAFRYNEKANDFPMQYLTKLFKLNSQFIIFDAPKYEKYEEVYEVFEEQEPEINFLSSLNRKTEPDEEENIELPKENDNSKDDE